MKTAPADQLFDSSGNQIGIAAGELLDIGVCGRHIAPLGIDHCLRTYWRAH